MSDTNKLAAPAWMDADTELFIKYGQFFTPQKNEQYQIICELIDSASKVFGRERVAELCCGAGELAKHLLKTFPLVSIEAFDGSERMLEVARVNCGDFGDRFRANFFKLEQFDSALIPSDVMAIVSCLAIHHLDGDQKQTLFSRIYRSLSHGGIFVIADIMMPTSQMGIDISRRAWDRAVDETGRKTMNPPDIAEKFREERWNFFESPYDDPIDHPSSIHDHLNWLLKAGFSSVDLHWANAGHAIISASCERRV